MYPPAHYQVTDPALLPELIRQYNFASVTAWYKGEYLVSQIPLIVKEEAGKTVLYGHFAANNPIIQAIEAGTEISLVFNGPHAFVSSTWYNPMEASTWNYIMVHVQAKAHLMDSSELPNLLDELIAQEEGENSQAPRYADLPEKYTSALLPHIQGVKLDVLNMRGVVKLSQNKTRAQQLLIIEQLKNTGSALDLAVAEAMLDQLKD